RREIHGYVADHTGPRHYWLDLGNEEHHGQCVLGEVRSRGDGCRPDRLPMVTALFSDLLDTTIPEPNPHSCSLRLSLQAQGLFINDFMARCAMQILYRL